MSNLITRNLRTRWLNRTLWVLGGYLALSLGYAVKALLGIDMDPKAHHGNIFPVGQFIYDKFRSDANPRVLSFRDSYVRLKESAKVRGDVAAGWIDNSAWGNVRIQYKHEILSVAGRPSIQTINVGFIGRGSACQLVQDLRLDSWHQYTASLVVRAEPPARVSLMLREPGKPYRTFFGTTQSVGSQWTTLKVTGGLPMHNVSNVHALFMIRTVDRATVSIFNAGLAAQPPVPTESLRWANSTADDN